MTSMNTKNGVPYIVDHIPRSTRRRRPGTIRVPRTITMHSTGNPTSTARNERDWLTNPANINEFAGWHVVVDDREAIEAMPLNEVAWHAGDGNGEGNSFSIGVEVCESGNRARTLLNAAKVVAALLRENGMTTDNLRQHWNWNRKNCPRILRKGNGWSEFVASVQAWLNNEVLRRESMNDIAGHWAERDIRAVVESGLMSGFPDGTFKPGEPVTRAQLAVILNRLRKGGIKA